MCVYTQLNAKQLQLYTITSAAHTELILLLA